ncbi:unnamed protein product [Moneuplotes crassus]|uniref:Uncharacterized protein n=1 Tax=Euplotes crassus TaxID=5936 RepID=A0AAD1U5Z2_EUPCR|nr:unnamed protein product [Moneuplotes crassus]
MDISKEHERVENLNQILQQKIQSLQERYDRLREKTDKYEEIRSLEIANTRYSLENTSLKNQLLKYKQLNTDLEEQKNHLVKVVRAQKENSEQPSVDTSNLQISKKEVVFKKNQSKHTFVKYYSLNDSDTDESLKAEIAEEEIELQKTFTTPKAIQSNREHLFSKPTSINSLMGSCTSSGLFNSLLMVFRVQT